MTAPLFNAFPTQSGAPVFAKRGGWLHNDCAEDCCCFRNLVAIDAYRRVNANLQRGETTITVRHGNAENDLISKCLEPIQRRAGGITVRLDGDIDGVPFSSSAGFPSGSVVPASDDECELFEGEIVHWSGGIQGPSPKELVVSPCDTDTFNRVEMTSSSEFSYYVRDLCPSSPYTSDDWTLLVGANASFGAVMQTWATDEPRYYEDRFIPARHIRMRFSGGGSGRDSVPRSGINHFLVMGGACVVTLKCNGEERTIQLAEEWLHSNAHDLNHYINDMICGDDTTCLWTWFDPVDIDMTINPIIP